MARYMQPTPEQEAGWRQWTAERPERVRKVAERFEPWSLYRMKSTGHRVTVAGFDEDVPTSCSNANTKILPVGVRVLVLAEFNRIAFERQVFGVDPDDLEPCDLPEPNEKLGAAMSQEQVADNIDVLRAGIRPDLWQLGPDGKAVRKH